MTKKLLLNEWEELGGENAAKGTLKKLADKYSVPEGTVRRWKSEHLKKSKANVHNKKRTNVERVKERDIQVKKDILNDIPREEVMRKNEISNATYYRKEKSVRELRLEKTEEQLDDILLKVYSDLGDVLKNVEISKRNLVIRMAKEISKDETLDAKRLQIIDKAYVTIKKMGNDLMRTGKMLTAYELLEVDKQLAEEALQQEKLDIERSKLKTDINEDNKIEIKLVGI
jgi:putative pbsx phage terminase small subunit|nr:MAG TPA: helix-turn-helix domain protein [Caudoviricetes sp.]